MKHLRINLTLVVTLLFISYTPTFAYDFEVNGIYYNVVSLPNLTCEVTFGNSKYSGQITIPEQVTYNTRTFNVININNNAFSGCSSLTDVTIPNSVTEIGNYAFQYCRGLTNVTIGNSVTEIGYAAFKDCSSLTNVIIGSSVTTIGSSAFKGCIGLTSVTIPNSVTEIGNYAFDGCSSLEKLTIADGSSNLKLSNNSYDNYNGGEGLFYDCPLKSIYLGRNLTYGTTFYSGYSPFYRKNELTNLTIGNTVTQIGSSAFSGCSSLTDVTIPNSVTEIANRAFDGCSSLEKLTIADGSSNLKLSNNSYDNYNGGEGLFYDCPLKSIYLGRNLTYGTTFYSGYSPFYRKNELTNLTIGNTVTQIGEYAFYCCSSLTGVTIPNSVTEIGNYAFSSCSSLTNVTIPNSVTTIGGYAFNGCRGLTSVTIPNSVTEIGNYAFRYCRGLTNVTIGSSVTTIGSSAFDGCSELESIISLATTAPSADENTFSNRTYVNATLYIPVGSLESYKSSTCWKNFLIEEKDDIANVEGVKTNKNLVEKARYSLEGKKLLTPKKGINIIKMSDGTTKKIIVK